MKLHESMVAVDEALRTHGMRVADSASGEPGWYVTVLVEGEPVKVWATDQPDQESAADALLAVVTSAHAYDPDVPRTEKRLDEAQDRARTAGATESEIDAALSRGQQDAADTNDSALDRTAQQETKLLEDALLAVAGAARAYAEGVPEAVAGLDEAQGLARAAGATESEVDSALVRGQRDSKALAETGPEIALDPYDGAAGEAAFDKRATDKDRPNEVCHFCGASLPYDEAASVPWEPYFYRGDVEVDEPVCTDCMADGFIDYDRGEYSETPAGAAHLKQRRERETNSTHEAAFDEHAAEQAALDRVASALRAADYVRAADALHGVDPIPEGFHRLLNALDEHIASTDKLRRLQSKFNKTVSGNSISRVELSVDIGRTTAMVEAADAKVDEAMLALESLGYSIIDQGWRNAYSGQPWANRTPEGGWYTPSNSIGDPADPKSPNYDPIATWAPERGTAHLDTVQAGTLYRDDPRFSLEHLNEVHTRLGMPQLRPLTTEDHHANTGKLRVFYGNLTPVTTPAATQIDPKLLRTLESALTGRGHFEVHFPDGTVREMTREELHGDLKRTDPGLHARVKYRWVEAATSPAEQRGLRWIAGSEVGEPSSSFDDDDVVYDRILNELKLPASSLTTAKRDRSTQNRTSVSSGLNQLLRDRAEAERLRDASLQAAEHALDACGFGRTPTEGRADRDQRKTATLDLRDHWDRALLALTASAALAELAHAATAAREAHGSDEYERRAVEMVESGAPAVLPHESLDDDQPRTRLAAATALEVFARDQDGPSRRRAAKVMRGFYGTLRDGSPEANRARSQVRTLEGRTEIPHGEVLDWDRGWRSAERTGQLPAPKHNAPGTDMIEDTVLASMPVSSSIKSLRSDTDRRGVVQQVLKTFVREHIAEEGDKNGYSYYKRNT